MKFGAQMNEIAGPTLQELPPAPPIALSAAAPDEAGGETKIILPVDFSSFKDTSFQWSVAEAAGKTAMNLSATASAGAKSEPTAGSLERVGQMINREVVTVRQSGAETLAVSLKVDAHTSLFLQLTNHKGQIEASVRCEKGDAGALGGHWGQLQESLARQNVHLQALGNGQPPIKLPSEIAPGQKDFNQRTPHHTPPQPDAPPEKKVVPSDDAMNAAIGISKSKHHPHPHHGWEKWA